MEYNYLTAMVEDIRNYINENVNLSEYEDRDELEEKLNDELWAEDSVTGNASGSYTFNYWTAKEYVTGNMELVSEMASDFGIDGAEIAEKFLNEEWEWFDVSIRCHLLSRAISEALNQLDYDFEEPVETIVEVRFLLPETV